MMNEEVTSRHINIPTELLIKIVDHLGREEKREGLLICKSWYEIFRHGLYTNIIVDNNIQLELLWKALLQQQHSTNIVLPSGSIVKQIYIRNNKLSMINIQSNKTSYGHFDISRNIFEKLPDLCPNLQVLDFDCEMWKEVLFHSHITKWSKIYQIPTLANIGISLPFLQRLGKQLTTLSIQSSMLINISTHSILTTILSMVPNVKRLVILGDNKETQTRPSLTLTLLDIETIHELLPLLESLEIIGDNIQMNMMEPEKKDLSHIVTISTPTTLKTLYLDTHMTFASWAFYIAHKHPHLRELKLSIQSIQPSNDSAARTPSSIANNIREEMSQIEADLFLDILRNCRYLETISLSGTSIEHWLNPTFFQTLREKTPFMRQITPIVKKNNQIKLLSELETIIKYGKNLITAMEIEQWRMNSKNLPFTLESLKGFNKLTYLEIKCDSYNTDYPMDKILDNCPYLETLILEWGILRLPVSIYDPSQHVITQKINHHPLKSFSITFIAFPRSIFDYLASRCQNLTHLYIRKCKQLYVPADVPSRILVEINMPQNKFDTIIIHGIRLDFTSSVLKSMGVISNYIRLVSIGTKNQEKSWYHHKGYSTKGPNDNCPIIEQMTIQDSSTTEAYFKQLRECKMQNEITDGTLKTSLMFGHIKINCGSLNNFMIDSYITNANSCLF